MGKKGGTRRAPNQTPWSKNPVSLREESTGKKQTKGGGGSNNVKSLLKLEHLQKIAVWAGGEANVPSLGAFFGHRLAATAEALGVPPDPSLFSCQRCETILQPGFNCTIRIEKNKVKARRRHKKSNNLTENNVVYTCHFCSTKNIRRGTAKGHMRVICPPKAKKTSSKTKTMVSTPQKTVSNDRITESKEESFKEDGMVSAFITKEIPIADSLATPLLRTGSGSSLLDGKRRKRNRSTSKKQNETESGSNPVDGDKSAGTSNKRRRKLWTSLKEIAQTCEQDSKRDITNLAIPFAL